MNDLKIIDEKVYNGSQSVNYELIAEFMTGHAPENKWRTIRIRIKKDSISHQSYAKLEIWAETQWNMVNYIHYSMMNTTVGPYTQGVTKNDFSADKQSLINIAKQIL